ncbi:DUF3865 domain-containing protein [Grimontia hollisae]|uniref:Uncharacterized protein n=2 Tax=Grimontia hollisae TaxID=673 RepID=D0I8D3_GRIHO|nr:DUF3865 domain-containing protein [Grimontia hollisae]AMG30981.1 DUF3865 domain-containing protein [Grimontia hollisae]EEY72902.1 hypothetical protein VHA_002008 [Grimontia hollisae CIP 101886]MDF2184104.1 DUF3865 domain-containing protein [Grimontia hollisae]STO46961.1 Domain of Uncharacterised Function with PDB structure [Grimontia hollisae]STO56171.1 Domain of Uncharacterised Function with PDB structure [Grimontia hollisae]
MNTEMEKLEAAAVAVANNGYLVNVSENMKDFTPEDYQTFYSNMVAWLEPTKTRLQVGLERLRRENDRSLDPVIAAFEHNILDESGEGCVKSDSHAVLFNKSCHTYFEQVYSAPLSCYAPSFETLHLRDASLLLFSKDSFEMMGACFAQEVHALPQLQRMYQGHLALRDKCHNDWAQVSRFYDVHFDGTEARHAEDLRQTLFGVVDTKPRMTLFKSGFISMICLLTQFWKSLEVRTA